MQISDTFSKGGPPSPNGGGGSPTDIAIQLQQQKARHRRILMLRTLRIWWYPLVLAALGSFIAVQLVQIMGIAYPIPILLILSIAIVALPVYIQCIRRVDFGLVVFALATTALGPKLISLKGADIYPSQVFIGTLFCTLLVQAAFRVRKITLPSLRAIWPQAGLFVLAIISNIMVQLTWTHGVPHKLNNNPIIYDEFLGCIVFSFPLMTYVIVNMIVASNERLITYIQRIFMIAAMIVSIVVLYDFKRMGGDINSFRYSEPHILWMSLRAIAQLQVLGCMLAYARFLYAPTWRARMLYCLLTILFLATVIISLENSWWIEVGLGLILMTIIYSWRLLVFYFFLLIPFIPVLKAELTKLQSVKSEDTIRFIIWLDSLRVWTKQPVLGVGPGNFWVYDQTFTHLPRALHNCNATGLCVAHNGYLQTLGELGPLGLFFFLAFPVVMIVLAAMLYRRSPVCRKRSKTNPFLTFVGWIGLDLADVPDKQVSKPKKGSWSSGIYAFLYDDRSGKSEPRKGFWRGVVRAFLDDDRSEKHINRMLGLAVIGLTAGSIAADFFAGGFFIPPRQISVLAEMPQVVTSWIMWGLLMYRDQQWIANCKKAKAALLRPSLYLRKLYPTFYPKRSW